jgi:hypothetical protein
VSRSTGVAILLWIGKILQGKGLFPIGFFKESLEMIVFTFGLEKSCPVFFDFFYIGQKSCTHSKIVEERGGGGGGGAKRLAAANAAE